MIKQRKWLVFVKIIQILELRNQSKAENKVQETKEIPVTTSTKYWTMNSPNIENFEKTQMSSEEILLYSLFDEYSHTNINEKVNNFNSKLLSTEYFETEAQDFSRQLQNENKWK